MGAILGIIRFIFGAKGLAVLMAAMLFPGSFSLPGTAPEEAGESPVLGLREVERAEDSFFDDAMIVGDSVTLKLSLYVRRERKTNPTLLGDACFFTAGSLGSGNIQRPVSPKSIHPKLNGTKMLLEDAVAAAGAKKLYIMLGMNDIANYGIEGSVENMLALIGKVREKSPDVEIYVESVTPRARGRDEKRLNNASIVQYNEALYRAIEASGIPNIWFLDVASALRDEDGTLPRAYCSDPGGMGIHFTDAACEIWIDYLYTHWAKP